MRWAALGVGLLGILAAAAISVGLFQSDDQHSRQNCLAQVAAKYPASELESEEVSESGVPGNDPIEEAEELADGVNQGSAIAEREEALEAC